MPRLNTLVLAIVASLSTTSVGGFSPIHPSRSTRLPEEVVGEQLRIMRNGDMKRAYEKFISAEAKEATGNSWSTFADELEDEPFEGLKDFQNATVLMTTFNDYDRLSCSCLVRVTPKRQKGSRAKSVIPIQYWWELSKSENTGEWFVDGVIPDFESMSVAAEELEGQFLLIDSEDDDEDFDWDVGADGGWLF